MALSVKLSLCICLGFIGGMTWLVDRVGQPEFALPVNAAAELPVLTAERALEMMRQVTEVAASEGLEFHLERAVAANTFDAHRVTHLAAARGLGRPVMERLMRAYQSEGENVADRETLARLAAEADLPAEDVRATLASGAYADAVEADLERARRYGVSGVPFFVFDASAAVSGAQPTELFLSALRQLGPQRPALRVLEGAEDAACGPDGCEVRPG